MEIVILAGGKGERISKYIKKSKTLIKIEKTNLLQKIYNTCLLYNFKRINLIINDKQNDIKDYVKNNKLNIKIIIEKRPLGDGNCLKLLKKIKNYNKKNFLVIHGDLLINVNLSRINKFHQYKKSDLTLVTHPNSHPHDSDLVEYDDNYKLLNFFKKPHKKIKTITALSGIFILKGKLIKKLNTNKKISFSKKILPSFIKNKKIYCYETREFIMDVGTMKRLKQAKQIIKKDIFLKANIKFKKPAFFLDRDGVINKEYKNLKFQNPTNFKNGILEGLKKIRKMGYLIIVITNQSCIAKGFITEKKLYELHNKMQLKLNKSNIYIDKIYYCPHHPEKGFKNEVKRLKIICNCRKPNNGLLKKAIKELNINVQKSFFIGNSEVDYLCAKKTKIHFLKVGDKNFNFYGKSFNTLSEAVKSVI